MKLRIIKCFRWVLLVALSVGFVHAADAKPNILFILTDDQGYGDLGSYGSKDIKTPHIDSLAEEGMKFESFYVHNRCSPTRAAFMTGCHAQRVDMAKVIYRGDRSGLNSNEVTVAELLKEAGYRTGIVGKWHLGEWDQFNPTRHGFDSFYGFMEYGGFKGADRKTGIYQNNELIEADINKTDGVHSPKLLAAGIEFMRANRKSPFFLYYASPLPHTKWDPHEDFKGSSDQGTYGDVIQEIDWQVGALLAELEALGLSENTLVVYASDNGPQLNVDGHGSAGGLRDGKWSNFEGGIRVPCLMRWPGNIPAGAVNDEIVGIIDLLPTFAELAGIESPTDRIMDGRSIVPYLLGQHSGAPIHETFVVPGATIRRNGFKLLVSHQKPGGSMNGQGDMNRKSAPAGALFDLNIDLGESIDVSAEHPAIVAQMQDEMIAFIESLKRNMRPRENVNTP